MRLKTIKLAGFKSFVDPTPASFPENLTAVVGPNGCGKSNIIDAVRWVLRQALARRVHGGRDFQRFQCAQAGGPGLH
jgi:chromosome segregation protein